MQEHFDGDGYCTATIKKSRVIILRKRSKYSRGAPPLPANRCFLATTTCPLRHHAITTHRSRITPTTQLPPPQRSIIFPPPPEDVPDENHRPCREAKSRSSSAADSVYTKDTRSGDAVANTTLLLGRHHFDHTIGEADFFFSTGKDLLGGAVGELDFFLAVREMPLHLPGRKLEHLRFFLKRKG